MKSGIPRRNRSTVAILVNATLFIAFVQLYLSNFLDHSTKQSNHFSSTRSHTLNEKLETQKPLSLLSQETPKKKQAGLKYLPQWDPNQKATSSSEKQGAFIHMGKTGGSTLSLLLRNGCHSYMAHPCRVIPPPESPASLLISTYYHVPDFAFLQQANHSFYVVTTRDPYDRVISAFCYEHLANREARSEPVDSKKRLKYVWAYQCFPTLESYVSFLAGNSSDFHYPYHKREVHPESCVDLARAAFHGMVKLYNHFYFSFERIQGFLKTAHALHKPVYVARQEHLWSDWDTLNLQLQSLLPPSIIQRRETFVPPELAHQGSRNMTKLVLPVTRTLSANGTVILCRALQQEYEAYFWFLQRAKNFADTDLESSIIRAEERCGAYLPMRRIAASVSF